MCLVQILKSAVTINDLSTRPLLECCPKMENLDFYEKVDHDSTFLKRPKTSDLLKRHQLFHKNGDFWILDNTLKVDGWIDRVL